MLELKNDNGMLVVSGNIGILKNPVIRSFLTHHNFLLIESESRYILKGKYSIDLVENLVKFFTDYNEPLELDSECKKLYHQKIDRNEDFLRLQTEGRQIKNSTQIPDLLVPSMSSNNKLTNYQVIPVLHASTLGNVANFSVPGSGKTWMAYSTYFLLKNKPKNDIDRIEKLLIVSPISAFRPWEIEYKEITGNDPTNSIRITGNSNQRQKIFESSNNYEIFLISYATAANERDSLIQLLQRNKFMMIVDESHHIKNPFGKASTALIEIAPFAHKRMILTGTMIPNNLEDLWSQFTFLYPDGQLVGSYDRFKFNLSDPNALANLSNQLSPFFTRISKSTLNLPAPVLSRIKVPMSPIQQRIYQTISGHIKENDPNYRSDLTATRRWRRNSLVYLLEVSTDPSLLIKSSQFQEDLISSEGLPIEDLLQQYAKFEIPQKLQLVEKLVEENAVKNDKVIIWCNFISTIEKLEKMLERFKPVIVYGEIPRDDQIDPDDNREIRIDSFKNDLDKKVLIANPASLAESISLHKICHHAIYVDRTFNGGNYMQSLERIHRIGVDPHIKTKYTILLSENSIDYDVDLRLEIKKHRMEKFLDEDGFGTLNLDLDYKNFSDSDDDLDDDYAAVLRHLTNS